MRTVNGKRRTPHDWAVAKRKQLKRSPVIAVPCVGCQHYRCDQKEQCHRLAAFAYARNETHVCAEREPGYWEIMES